MLINNAMVKNTIFLIAMLTVVLAGSRYAEACCGCDPENASQTIIQRVNQAKNEASAVFTGKVVKIQDGDDSGPRLVTLQVETSWKGPLAKNVEIVTGREDSCGFDFKEGVVYLVYAYRLFPGNLVTTHCTRTRLLSNVEKDEIDALGKAK